MLSDQNIPGKGEVERWTKVWTYSTLNTVFGNGDFIPRAPEMLNINGQDQDSSFIETPILQA